MTLLTAATALQAAGLAVIPVRNDGSKSPAVDWKRYQHTPPDLDQLHAWFDPDAPDPWGRPRDQATPAYDGLGVVCGAASGNLEMLEVEGRAVDLVPRLAALMTDSGLGELWARLCAGYLEQSPSGGLHWLYRVDGPARANTKLARRPATTEELTEHKAAERAAAAHIDNYGQRTERLRHIEALTADRLVQVLVETRGEGGFTVTAPSAGRAHRSGQPWRILAGEPGTIPLLTVDERDALHVACSTFDAMPTLDAPARPLNVVGTGQGDRPGDDYNNRASWDDILVPHGWTRTRHFGGICHGWTRPGKNPRDGISATTGRNDADNLFVFTSSTEFDTERAYSKFAAYVLLHHGGDYSVGARQLRTDGYGKPAEAITPPEPPKAAQQPPVPPQAASLTIVDGTAARQPETPAPKTVVARYGPTEDGVARALVELHAHELRYCPQRGRWLAWNGHKWTWDEAEVHRERIRTIARSLPEHEAWRTFKKRALSAAGVTGIARHAQTDAAITVHIDTLDARPFELNTPGGIVDLRTGALRDPDPEALHTRSTMTNPDFDGDDSLLTDFLTTTFGGDTELVSYVQRLFGLAAIGQVLEQILPFGHGSGANGKSTLLEAVMHALGRGETGYAIAAAAEMLMVRKHSEHPAEIAQLAGARLVVCSELDDGQRFAEARIKQLTGRDSLNARFMRRDPFTFTPSHTIWLLGNHKPATSTGGPAFWRRTQLVPFDHVVPEDQRDAMLGEKLAEAAPVVLAWVVRGAADYMAGGLRTPTAVKSATAAYAHDQDTVGRFVEEDCHRAPASTEVQVEVTVLRSAYERWCHDAGDDPVSPRRLTQELRSRYGVESVKGGKGRRFYRGLALIDNERSATHDDEGGDREWYR